MFLKKRFLKNQLKTAINIEFHFFICYLAASLPTLGHYQGNSFTPLTLVNVFYQFFT